MARRARADGQHVPSRPRSFNPFRLRALRALPARRDASLIRHSSGFRPAPSRLSRLLAVALSILAAAGCAHRERSGEETGSLELNVAAASNLTAAFEELGKQFTAQTGVRVVFSFGATVELSKQIENGAPFDVFAAADVEQVDALNRSGLVSPGTNHLYARGRLVLWTPPESPHTINRLEDLTRAEIERVAIAKPDLAPYGRAAIEALRALNLWAQVEPKVVYGQNVSQARQYAATGNAEAAFIPRALVKAGEGSFVEVDERLHGPINQAVAVIRDSPRQEAARRFVAYLLSPEGQGLLERYGYKKVTGDE
ncbi:MAG TPA: molybdate ABC transporter substrate-binding protein [Pyrinomonadaceae bacterium]|jgi:molybdate transport system substrate-binding protein